MIAHTRQLTRIRIVIGKITKDGSRFRKGVREWSLDTGIDSVLNFAAHLLSCTSGSMREWTEADSISPAPVT